MVQSVLSIPVTALACLHQLLLLRVWNQCCLVENGCKDRQNSKRLHITKVATLALIRVLHLYGGVHGQYPDLSSAVFLMLLFRARDIVLALVPWSGFSHRF